MIASHRTGLNAQTYHQLPADEASLASQNEQLKRDLEFATSEVARLRAKLVLEDQDMTALSVELATKEDSMVEQPKGPRDPSIDAVNTSDILKAPSLVPAGVTNSRNAQSVQRFNTGGGSGLVPKLDFKQLKKVQEFKDWYAYACKLEDSVKFLRDRTRNLEKDLDTLNDKYRKEVA